MLEPLQNNVGISGIIKSMWLIRQSTYEEVKDKRDILQLKPPKCR